jgi:hypothetical protein
MMLNFDISITCPNEKSILILFLDLFTSVALSSDSIAYWKAVDNEASAEMQGLLLNSACPTPF